MNVLSALLVWAVFGLIVGALARLLIPGRQPMTILATMLLGVVGSLLGGLIAWLIVGGSPLQGSGFLLSLVGAVLVLLIYVSHKRRRAGA